MRGYGLLLLMVLASGPAAQGALVFQTDEIETSTYPDHQSQEVNFYFRNDSREKVAIVGVQTDCDCTDAKANKPTYMPGEVGFIHVRFPVVGQAKYYEFIQVKTSEQNRKPYELDIVAHFSDAVELSPTALEWRTSDKASDVPLILRALKGGKVTVSARSEPAGMLTVKVIPSQAGSPVELRVRPKNSSAMLHGHLVIDVSGSDGTHTILVPVQEVSDATSSR